MKKLFYLFFFCFISFNAASQIVNGKDLASIESEYIFAFSTSKTSGGKIFVEVDYGQEFKNSLLKDAELHKIMNEKGKVMEFNSMIDVLNYITSNGWDLVQSFVPESGNIWSGNRITLHYLFKKRK